jgi:hypothetical protein
MAYDPEALDALSMEKELMNVTDGQLAEKIFEQNAAKAALVICNIATNGTTEQMKLRASQYVCDRVLGPTAAKRANEGEKADALEDFVRGIVKNNS